MAFSFFRNIQKAKGAMRMKWRKILAILLALSILCSLPITTALAADGEMEEAEYELYPLPQEITYGTDNSTCPQR